MQSYSVRERKENPYKIGGRSAVVKTPHLNGDSLYESITRSLDALKVSLSGDNKTVMLDKDSELARILYGNFEE